MGDGSRSTGTVKASIYPTDPVIRVGGSLNLSCTLDPQATNHTSESIVWMKGSTLIPTERYATPNASISQLRLSDVSTTDAGKYYCKFSKDEWGAKRGVHVFVGRSPVSVENVTCEATSPTDFWCKWDHRHETSNLAVTYTVRFRTDTYWKGHSVPQREKHSVNTVSNWTICQTMSASRHECTCNSESFTDLYVRIETKNVLGTEYRELSYRFDEIVRPAPPQNLSVTTLHPHCLDVSWQSPKHWQKTFNEFYLLYRLQYRLVDDFDAGTNIEDIYTTEKQLCGLRSFAQYEVKVSSNYFLNANGLWSAWSTPVIRRTVTTVPTGSPQNLTLAVTAENPSWVLATWMPVDPTDANGIVSGYGIYSCMVNDSRPLTQMEQTLATSESETLWISDLCIENVTDHYFNATLYDTNENTFSFTLLHMDYGSNYLVWGTAMNAAGEGPPSRPTPISVPEPQAEPGRRSSVVIVAVITVCQITFVLGLCVFCWLTDYDLFKRSRRVPQPYIPSDVLSMKHETLKPKASRPAEFFDEIRKYPSDKTVSDKEPLDKPSTVTNSGGSSVDHGFYDMQSSSGGSGSQYVCNSSQYNPVSTIRCNAPLCDPKINASVTSNDAGYSVPCPFARLDSGGKPLLRRCDDYEVDSHGYINPNEVEAVVMSRQTSDESDCEQPPHANLMSIVSVNADSDQSKMPTALALHSDQGFGSADSDGDSRQASPTVMIPQSFLDLRQTMRETEKLTVAPGKECRAECFSSPDREGSPCSARLNCKGWSPHYDDVRLPATSHGRRKSASSSKSSGCESDGFPGYMLMATMEETNIDYGYVVHDPTVAASEPDVEKREEGRNAHEGDRKHRMTYDIEDVNEHESIGYDDPVMNSRDDSVFSEHPCGASSTVEGDMQRTAGSKWISISQPSSSSPCSSTASSPMSVNSLSFMDGESPEVFLDTAPSQDHGCLPLKWSSGYVSHHEVFEMCKPPDVRGKSDEPDYNCIQYSQIKFLDPELGYVSNVVFS
ncbi:uncharacterized protein [Diadema antillarum]|uniref:uncharacterized protein n=1 Tax=Diadema antillarum TaxID=105358 RepID=UPI003A8C58EB